jgi:HAD superfamily hydrolase (TIGR01549 family)
MEIKGIFFDLYGTLLKYGDMQAAWLAVFDALYRILSRYNCPVDRNMLWESCRGLLGEAEPPCIEDGFTVYERRLERLFKRLLLRCNAEVVKCAATETLAAGSRYISVDPDAVPVLQALSEHYILALVSNFDHPPHIHAVLKESALNHWFKSIVISGEVGVKKPSPGILLIAAHATGLRPDKVAYVGDSREDMESARAAAMFGVWLENGGEAVAAGAHYERDRMPSTADAHTARGLARAIIRDLCELPGLFNGLAGGSA